MVLCNWQLPILQAPCKDTQCYCPYCRHPATIHSVTAHIAGILQRYTVLLPILQAPCNDTQCYCPYCRHPATIHSVTSPIDGALWNPATIHRVTARIAGTLQRYTVLLPILQAPCNDTPCYCPYCRHPATIHCVTCSDIHALFAGWVEPSQPLHHHINIRRQNSAYIRFRPPLRGQISL